jgi:hypothetical protein
MAKILAQQEPSSAIDLTRLGVSVNPHFIPAIVAVSSPVPSNLSATSYKVLEASVNLIKACTGEVQYALVNKLLVDGADVSTDDYMCLRLLSSKGIGLHIILSNRKVSKEDLYRVASRYAKKKFLDSLSQYINLQELFEFALRENHKLFIFYLICNYEQFGHFASKISIDLVPADVHLINYNQLLKACQNGDSVTITRLLNQGIDVSHNDYECVIELMKIGDLECMKIMFSLRKTFPIGVIYRGLSQWFYCSNTDDLGSYMKAIQDRVSYSELVLLARQHDNVGLACTLNSIIC